MLNLLETLKSAKIPFSENIKIAPKTTFKIGSTANLFIAPANASQFAQTLDIITSFDKPFFVLGGGSNTVFPDKPFTPIVVSTENLKSINITQITKITQDCVIYNNNNDDDVVYVTCQAGTSIASLINFCISNSISGIEQFAGLPGSVGGAVYMNARCFNKSINEIFYSADYVEIKNNKVITSSLTYDESQWKYKVSPFQPEDGSSGKGPHKYVLSATFKLHKLPIAEKKSIETECKKYISERVSKGHFKYPSAGSVFKNNRSFGKPSGIIIDEAGLKGFSIGGAQIAPFHGNFIINLGNAKSSDVQELVKKVQITVHDKFGFDLEPEIIFL